MAKNGQLSEHLVDDRFHRERKALKRCDGRESAAGRAVTEKVVNCTDGRDTSTPPTDKHKSSFTRDCYQKQ